MSSVTTPPSIDCGGVLLQETIRKRKYISPTKTLLLFAFVCSFAVLVGMRSLDSLRGTDFPDFYCAARVVAEGHGHQLYDAGVQRQYQARYAGRVGTLYIHPPFEAVLYTAVAWLPLRRAYLLWSFLNLALLAAAARQLAKETMVSSDWSVLLAASLTFVPCVLCFLQGQDSLLLLLVVTIAFTALRQKREFLCGCCLGLGLFKFEIVLPLALVLVLTQSKGARSAFFKGFCLTAVALATVSGAIAGWSVFIVYPKFLLHLNAQPYAGIVPHAMANFRGLASLLFQGDGTGWAMATVMICSALTLLKTVNDWKAMGAPRVSPAGNTPDKFDLAFANTVLFALLASYHLNPHDLSLLLLPIFLLLHRTLAHTPRLSASENAITGGLIAMLFLPPLHLWALRAGIYALVSLPVIALFLTGMSRAQEIRAAPGG